MNMEPQQRRNIIEGALLAAAEPLSLARLLSLFEEEQGEEDKDEGESNTKAEVLIALEEIRAQCEGRGFELKEVASGWRFQVRPETAPWVNRLWEEKPQKYSRAILETLALVAYRQPITRGDIEEIRGVAVSSHIIKTLAERDWIKVVGHRDVPGRPALYATSRQFLDYFNLKSLEELPSLGEIRDLDEINSMLDLDGQGSFSSDAQHSEDEKSDLNPDQDFSDRDQDQGDKPDVDLESDSEADSDHSADGHGSTYENATEHDSDEDTLASADFWSGQSEPALDLEAEKATGETSESDTDQSSSADSDADDQEHRSA